MGEVDFWHVVVRFISEVIKIVETGFSEILQTSIGIFLMEFL